MKTLLDVCELIVDCPHSTAKDEGAGYPLIRTPNIGKGRFILDGVHLVSEDVYNKRNHRVVPMDDDIILAREAPAGNVAIIKNGAKYCLGQRTVLIRPNKKSVNPDFLTYYLLAPEQQHKLLSSATGATVAHVNMPVIRGLEVSLPPLETQNRIASILSAYDDLIENNQKQIKLLEEAAQRLYKEWFVDLRFPGHEDVKIVDGVPEGWKKSQLRNIGEIITGKTPSTSNTSFYGNEIPFVTIPDMHNEVFVLKTGKCLSVAGAESQKSKYIPKDSIMISCIGTVGLVCLSDKICQTNQQINSLVLFNKKDLYYVYHSLLNIESMLDGIGSNGTTMTNVNKEKFSNIELLIPSNIIICMYYDMCKPIFEKILGIRKQIYCLQEARDRLLPKLMSGEIEV